MADALAKNHERIWLQPLCCVDERCWCDQPQSCDDDGCELPAIEYVRADLAANEIERLRADIISLRAEMYGEVGSRDAKIERLTVLILDGCKVFERYDLPEHAFHYRRAILGLDQATKMARGETIAATGERQ